MSISNRTTEDMLEHWGRWVVLGSGVSCCASRENDLPTPMITDDDALVIDGLVGRLRERYAESGNVIVKYYTTRDADLITIGERLGFGRSKTRDLWKAGVAWIDGALDARRKAS